MRIKIKIPRLLIDLLKECKKDPVLTFSIVFLGVVLIFAIIPEIIAPYPYAYIDLNKRLLPPSLEHIFGTDGLGRDIFSRIVYGARYEIFIILLATLIGMPIGLILGFISGYFGGSFDRVISLITDVQLSFPPFILMMIIVLLLGPSLINAIIAVSIYLVPIYVRLVRGQVLVEREKLYIEAAIAIGSSSWRILVKHILPNTSGPLVVQTILNSSSAILNVAALSFLGFGAQPPTPEWGTMMMEGRPYFMTAPHAILFPGLMIFLLVFSLNTIGERLREIVDPMLKI
jgi:ABC-type dipeptide/oligopeptide/nickel transport system permease subunit